MPVRFDINPPWGMGAPAKHENFASNRCYVGEGINPSPTKGRRFRSFSSIQYLFCSLSSIYFHTKRLRNRTAGRALLALMGGACFFIVLTGPLLAEEKDSIFGESGIHYPSGFDPNTVGAVQGKASHFTRPEKGPVHFQLASSRETFTVLASPAWYWNDSQLKVSDGTEVIVRGSKSYGKDGRLYIVAQEIRLPATGQAVSFREPNGSPLWKGSGRSIGGGSGGFGSSSGGKGGFGGGFGGGGRGRR